MSSDDFIADEDGSVVVFFLVLSLALLTVHMTWHSAVCDAIALWAVLHPPSRRPQLAADDPSMDDPCPTGGNPP